MKESITARVGRIISGSVNALMDAVENVAPETVMEQAIREIDGVIDDVRTELGNVLARKHLASRRLLDANQKHESLSAKIDLAVQQNRDDLAEAAIANQLDIEAQIPILENTIADGAVEEKQLEGYITALQGKRREMKEELRQYRASRQTVAVVLEALEAGGQAAPNASDVERRTAKAQSAFERIFERQTGIDGSDAGESLKQAQQLAELEDLSRKNRIQQRLAAARARREEQAQ